MAMQGHLSDLSLAELIEISCNHRKTGQLKIAYPSTVAYFYFHKGELVDAKANELNGPEALYYALTLPEKDGLFSFDANIVSKHCSIKDSWKFLLLEGLRRLDEGTTPADSFSKNTQQEPYKDSSISKAISNAVSTSRNAKVLLAQMIGLLLLLIVAVGIIISLLSRDKVSASDSNKLADSQSFQPVISVEANTTIKEGKTEILLPTNSIPENSDVVKPTIQPSEASFTQSNTQINTNQPAKAAPQTVKLHTNLNSNDKSKETVSKSEPEDKTKSQSAYTIQVKIFISETGKVTQAMVENRRPGLADIENTAVNLALKRRYDGGMSGWLTVPIVVRKQ
jgi:hypothetical protein